MSSIKKFTPMVNKEKRKVCDLYYTFITGKDLILTFGNIYGRKILSEVRYLMIARDESFHPDSTDLFSDKTGHSIKHGLEPIDWVEAYTSVFNRGKLCKINGHLGIVAFPYAAYLALFFDIERDELVMIPYWRFHALSEFKEVFNKIKEYYGDISPYYDFRNKLIPLNMAPCGELIPYMKCSYALVTGVQLRNELRDLGFGSRGVSEREVCMLLYVKEEDSNANIRHSRSPLINPGEDVRIIRNPWVSKAYTDETPKVNKLCDVLYDSKNSNNACMINNFNCVISYRMNSWNPIIWCTNTGDVKVLPSKMYTSDEPYWAELESVFGKLDYTGKGEES